MMTKPAPLRLVTQAHPDPQADAVHLDQVFFALADPMRRKILERLDGNAFLVSELAAPFDISLQGVSRHIQVLVRAGLVQQERSGRISKCSLEVGPLYEAATWMNRFSKYWQQQFDVLAVTLAEIDERRAAAPQPEPQARRATRRKRKPTEPA